MIEERLRRVLAQNPTRTDFQKHYEEIVSENNNEKDRVTIEKTFEALLKLTESMSEEEQRAVKEGLDEEALTLFDLLFKPDLSPQEVRRKKKMAEGLYKTLQGEPKKIQDFAAEQSTRAETKVKIKDYLWDDRSELPESFEIDEKPQAIFADLLTQARRSRQRPSVYVESAG